MIDGEALSRFIAAELSLTPARAVPEVSLHLAVPTSGLHRLRLRHSPYWAYQWAGGTALARYILDTPEIVAGRRVLDLGCGGGLVSAPLARMGGRVTGVDAAPEAIGAARAYAEGAALDIDFQNTSGEALVEAGAQFDLVTALEIVEHVADVNAFLEAAEALVKPGGLLILSTINRTAKARALAIVGAERILQWAPEGAHEYDKLVKPDEIRAGAAGIRWDEPVGITYQPLGAGWALSSDTDVNYMMAGAKV